MKKLLLAIVILFAGISLNAQNKKCNRLFLHQKGNDPVVYIMNKIDSISFAEKGSSDNLILHKSNGTREEFLVDELDSLIFKNVEGRVAADVNIINSTATSVTLDIKRAASCVEYKMACMDYNSISTFGDDDLIYYFDKNVTETYSQDFENVEITGLSLDYNTEYAIVTVGIDEYGLSCDVVRAKFSTPAQGLVGRPDVNVEVIENNLYDFTLKFTPNADVSKYSVLVAQEGNIDYQYIMFSYAFDWQNTGDMIEGWGLEFKNTDTYQYTSQTPNTYYEVYIQALDANGNRAPYKVFKFKSKGAGGEGIAKVDITLGVYKLAEWMNENYEWVMLPSQFITFTPNDQTSAYRFNVILAENYKKDIDGYQEDLFSKPFMQTDGWYQYETLTTDYQIDPGTDCVAIAAAMNINDEWGPVTELYFTTSDKMPSKTAEAAYRVNTKLEDEQQHNGAKKSIEHIQAIPLIIK